MSDLEYVTVLSGLLSGMLNRMANSEIRGHPPCRCGHGYDEHLDSDGSCGISEAGTGQCGCRAYDAVDG